MPKFGFRTILGEGDFKIGRTAPSVRRIAASALTHSSGTTAYAIGDGWTDSATAPTATKFLNVVDAVGGYGVIRAVQLFDSAAQSTAGDFKLWIFTAAITLPNDNEAFSPTDAQLLTAVAAIDLSASSYAHVGNATAGAGGNRMYQRTGLELPFVTGAATKDLWYAIEVRSTYTGVASESLTPVIYVSP